MVGHGLKDSNIALVVVVDGVLRLSEYECFVGEVCGDDSSSSALAGAVIPDSLGAAETCEVFAGVEYCRDDVHAAT